MKNIKNKISIKQILFLMFAVSFQINSIVQDQGQAARYQQARQNFKKGQTGYLEIFQLKIDLFNRMIAVGFNHECVRIERNHCETAKTSVEQLSLYQLNEDNLRRMKEYRERLNNRSILIEQAFFEYQQEKRRAKVFGFLGGAAVSSFLSIVFFEQYSLFSKLAFIGATSAVTTFFSKKRAEQRCLTRPIIFASEIQHQPLVFQ